MIYFCAQRNRRTLVLARPALNGIDYLEVPDESEQTVLVLTMLRGAAALALGPEQVVILGGESVTGIATVSVAPMPDDANALRIEVDRAGDFSTYMLRLRADEKTDEPPTGIDPALAQIEFSFKAGCPVTTDCAPVSCCPVAAPVEPDINYLAKDYPGFVQVMLDRLAVTAPSWTERHAADLGVALVEVLAYVADHLSYRQDAVATEAYLGTARSRISLRRHARLVDYRVDEGENARVWVFLRADGEGIAVPAGTLLLPRVAGVAPRLDPNSAVASSLLAAGGVVFATLADATLSQALNEIAFHTWSDEACCLPAGATAATLKGHLDTLSVGAVLMFEEVLGPDTGAAEDADRTHRCAVQLTRVHHTDRFGQVLIDPVTGESITDIEWQAADALPFALCLSAVTDAEHGARLIDNISVARGNIVPADHGLWSGADAWESLGTVPEPPTAPINTAAGACCTTAGQVTPRPAQFFPSLASSPLTFARPFDATAPASALGSMPAADADPATPQIEGRDDHDNPWEPETDLLALPPAALGFLIEIERDGTAFLRFGDGEHGAAPATGQSFRARYRVGNGTAGNLGADTIGHVLTAETRVSAVRNPLPARGGRDPETMEAIRQSAPWAFRNQLRAVTEIDYGIRRRARPRRACRARHDAVDRQLADRVCRARSRTGGTAGRRSRRHHAEPPRPVAHGRGRSRGRAGGHRRSADCVGGLRQAALFARAGRHCAEPRVHRRPRLRRPARSARSGEFQLWPDGLFEPLCRRGAAGGGGGLGPRRHLPARR